MPERRTILVVTVVFAGVFTGVLKAQSAPAEPTGILFWLRPVTANGPHTISGGQIFVRPGAEVTLDLFLSGWTPAELTTFAAVLACADLTNTAGGSLHPLVVGSKVDETRPDFVFFEVPFLSTCNSRACGAEEPDTISCDAGAFLASVSDPDEPKYAATFVVAVSEDAEGTFLLGFDLAEDASIALDVAGISIEPIRVIPATIIVFDPSVVIPAVSSWGLAATTVLFLAAAIILLRRKRSVLSSPAARR